MTPSEALVETLRAEGVDWIPGIVGSAFMDALDLFPSAGIRFLPVRHEQTAGHMADAFARVSGRPGVCIGQNGPGVTNMVTSIAAAFLAHSPVVVITPSVTTGARDLAGFQEVDQMSIFRSITKYQIQLSRPDRMAEAIRTAFRVAIAERGPVQVDIPRDLFYGEFETEILAPHQYRTDKRGPGDPALLDEAAELLDQAEFPVLLAGMGVVESEAQREVSELAERLHAPVVTSYLHNDAFPSTHHLAVGPIGYQGSKAAMRLLSQADVVLAIGTRLSIFGTLPQYGLDYFPRDARLVQIDINHRHIGQVWPVEIGIIGDARSAAHAINDRLAAKSRAERGPGRREIIEEAKQSWLRELGETSSGNSQPISPRRALRDLADALPSDAIVTTDIGNVCSMANAYLQFGEPRKFIAALAFGNCGFAYPAALGAKVARPDCPTLAIVGDGAWGMGLAEVMTAIEEELPVTAIVMNNGQWGAEKRNQIDYYDSRFVGTEIGNGKEYDFAEIAHAMGAVGMRVVDPGELKDAYASAMALERPVVMDVRLDPEELAEPFRRDALRVPTRLLEKYQQAAVAS
jgi:sulfoacetaldehyde acetyltransferase